MFLSGLDFLLTAKRDKKAALRFLNKAIDSNGKPSLINIDKSGANTAAIKQYSSDARKRRIRPMLGFKSFWSARATVDK